MISHGDPFARSLVQIKGVYLHRMYETVRREAQTIFTCDKINQRIQDIRLNPDLNEKCHDDVEKLCAEQKKRVRSSRVASGQVMHCLRRRYYEISAEQCVDKFRGVMKQMQLDWRADIVTKKACQSDKNVFCPYIQY